MLKKTKDFHAFRLLINNTRCCKKKGQSFSKKAQFSCKTKTVFLLKKTVCKKMMQFFKKQMLFLWKAFAKNRFPRTKINAKRKKFARKLNNFARKLNNFAWKWKKLAIIKTFAWKLSQLTTINLQFSQLLQR